MQLQVFCQTDIGLRRDSNEDSFLIDESLGLYVVADGMGGHHGGEVASAMAVQTIRDVVLKSRNDQRKPDYRKILVDAYREASRRIYDRSHNENPELRGMGTTVVAALAAGSTLYVGNVGDSRAYLYSHSRLWQITEDHSLVNEQVRAGILAEKTSQPSPQRTSSPAAWVSNAKSRVTSSNAKCSPGKNTSSVQMGSRASSTTAPSRRFWPAARPSKT